MTPAQAARKAAEIMLLRGHCKNTEEDERGRVCFAGAVNVALYGRAFRPYEYDVDTEPVLTIFAAARDVLLRRREEDYFDVIAWNNRPEVTGLDVVNLLRDTARELDTMEREPGDPVVMR